MALPDLCFPLSISWCFQFDRFIANNSDTNIWGQSKELVLLDLNIWNGSLCYCFVIILSKSLVLALVSVVILVISFSKWPLVDVRSKRSFVRGVPEADPGLSGCSLLQFVCTGLAVSWGSQAGLGSPSGSVSPESASPLCSSCAHRGGAEFQPHPLGVLGQVLSDIHQNSNCTFSESGFQV